MSEVAVVSGRSPWRVRPDEGTRTPAVGIDARRALQLALAGLWLLDGVRQYQPAMFTPAFSRMLAATSAGNLASGATDPESGPLLALLALAYWPSARAVLPSSAVVPGAGEVAAR